jgi:hypothetical protein
MTKVPKLLRSYLAILIQRLFTLHADLDYLALIFLLEPYKKSNDRKLSVRERGEKYSYEVGDEDFHKLATYVLNKEALYYTPEVD